MKSKSFFHLVKEEPFDPILGLQNQYAADKKVSKVDLGAGIYRNENLNSWVLGSVRKAEALLLEEGGSKEYLPIDGFPGYVEQTKGLIFGERFLSQIYGAQTVGGTAALSIGGRLLKELGCTTLYLSSPTWANHARIFRDAGLPLSTYPYFNRTTRTFDFEAMLAALDKMPSGSAILLQTSCHNPTGMDPTGEQWEVLCDRISEKKIFPFFDFAYQGFGEGLVQDAAPISLFIERGVECAVAVSQAKNFGLYAERCGALFFFSQEENEVPKLASRVKMIIRGLYSNPPGHGARIVAKILGNSVLKEVWLAELGQMRDRIITMRQAFVASLREKSRSSTFDFMGGQRGMFSYTGLEKVQVERLIKEYGIYLPSDGRINVAGLNMKNLEYVTDAIVNICAV